MLDNLWKRYKYLIPVIPILLFFLLFFLYPLVEMVRISFYRSLPYGQMEKIFTAENYIRFMTDIFYLKVLWRSFVLGVAVTAVTVPLGFILAYRPLAIQRGQKKIFVFLCPFSAVHKSCCSTLRMANYPFTHGAN